MKMKAKLIFIYLCLPLVATIIGLSIHDTYAEKSRGTVSSKTNLETNIIGNHYTNDLINSDHKERTTSTINGITYLTDLAGNKITGFVYEPNNYLEGYNGEGKWNYYKDGLIASSYTGLVNTQGENYYYVKAGQLDFSYSGLIKFNNNVYRVVDGKVDIKTQGLYYVDNQWYYFNNGVVDWNYSNLILYNGGWYYVHNGKIDWTYSTLAQVDGNGTWYKVTNGIIDWKYTGLSEYYGGWYYIENGSLRWNYNGLVYHYSTWYYVKNGQIDWNYSNLVLYNGGWYYVHNGKIDWAYSTLAQIDGKGTWYKVTNGMIDWKYTGLSEYYGGWYYIENGKLNWNYNSLVYYQGIWYAIDNGQITWNHKGLVYFNGGYFYVENSQVNFNYNGVVNYFGRDYKVVNGVARVPRIVDYMDSVAQSLSSDTQFLILVDRNTHTVGIYNGTKYDWNNWAKWSCTVGKASTPTVTGLFKVGTKGRYFNTGTRGRCWYFTQIYGNYLFHSVIYDRSSSPVKIIDGSMGVSASHGCVRLSIDHAKWIYDNIPKGTTVYIY